MNSPIPDTRNSLILRLRDQRDIEAWVQFVAIYDPLVYRLARAKGMQDADAEELVQEVMASVARAVERWEPDSQRGRFRDWLFCIARNLMIDFLRRSKHRPIASGDSRNTKLLNTIVDPLSEECSSFDLEYRRELFHWAAEKVREQVRASTWQAFWMTSVERQSITEVANKLAISEGAVHIARSRVLGRLRQMVQELEQRDNS
ncbi:MAG: sigma-70 family RNA polymerase sigma factor [Planctomycetales bacterium]|nr:sigma-70 family RNA polymerase sigma factor [Planctomycetales bacterium]